MQASMEKQMKAERNKRAIILEAEAQNKIKSFVLKGKSKVKS